MDAVQDALKVMRTPPTMSPLVEALTEMRLSSVAYAGGHGVSDGRLGLALLYYVFPYAIRARTAVCLGSGGGLVPEIMRRAQCDLGLVGSRTYLVDAILPEAGYGGPDVAGGWMARRDSFRDPKVDIWLLSTLTEAAGSEFFSRLGREIDVLHIDADHSYAGARRDFELYSAFLSPHGIITMHDLRMVDISRLVDEISASGSWEVLRFADIGQGLAVVRRRSDALPRVIVGSYNQTELDGSISVTTAEPPKEAPPLWKYLTDPALYSRHAVAAQWLGSPDYVLEIGGYITPISSFISQVPRDYVLVDPLCSPLEAATLNGVPCRVRHLAIELKNFDASELEDRSYVVVFLGAQLDDTDKPFSEFVATVERFLRIVAGAKRAIIEFPPAWKSCRELFDCLISMLRPHVEFEITLDLSQNTIVVDGAPAPSERLVRRLFVLSGFAALPQERESQELIARILRGADAGRSLAPETLLSQPAAVQGTSWQATQTTAEVSHGDDGVLVMTPPNRWHYAALLRLNEEGLHPGGFVVEIDGADCTGNVYATLASQDLTQLSEQRRLLPDREGRVKIWLHGSHPGGKTTLLLRTGSEDKAGQVRITNLTVRQ